MTEMTSDPKPRRLKGHKAAATCCISSPSTPSLIATAAEDGCVCWFDLRCKQVRDVIEVGTEAVTSLCFKPGNEEVVYVSSGKEVKSFDARVGSSSSSEWKVVDCFEYNKEEINQIACSSKGSFLAATDDGGDIKIVDIRQQRIYKTLRADAGHTSICSSVQFLPWRPWEAVPENDMLDKSDKVCVVARGDGAVDVINIEAELDTVRSKGSTKPRKGSQSRSKDTDSETQDQSGRKRLHMDYSSGGHNAAVSCVAFSYFGERGRFIISGGNDKLVKVWDWTRNLDVEQASSSSDLLHLNINHNKKVNWLCTTPADTENLVVCDTTKVVKVYSVA